MHPDPVLKVKTLKREHYTKSNLDGFRLKKEQKISVFFLCENEHSNRNFFFQDGVIMKKIC